MANRLHRVHPRAIPLSETIEAWLVVAGLCFAVWFVKTDIVYSFLGASEGWREVASFVGGFFFTSMITTVPAIVALTEIAIYVPAWKMALIGAAGAVAGDLLIFRFVRSNLVSRILYAAVHPRARKVLSLVVSGPLWWVAPALGAIVIASPLPDELGLIMMGLSEIRALQFIPLALIANGAGIFIIATLAQRVV